MYHILIVEDDPKLRDLLTSFLQKYAYKVSVITDFQQIKQSVQTLQPDLILLDINLPFYDGFYWCRVIRTFSLAPIIFISARVGEMDQVMAIENGGDDYLTKPFHVDVALAKIKSLLRRTYGEYTQDSSEKDILEIHGLQLYKAKHELHWEEKYVVLTKNEAILLHVLMDNHLRIVDRDTLLESLWDDQSFVDDNTLTVNVTRVRKKLDELGLKEVIQTHRGKGYMLAIDAAVRKQDSKHSDRNGGMHHG